MQSYRRGLRMVKPTIMDAPLALLRENWWAITGEWLLALSGLFSLVLGLVFTMVPEARVVVLVWSLAAYTVAFGILLIWLSFKLRARHERTLPAAA